MFLKLLRIFLKENFGARRLFGSKAAQSKGRKIALSFLFVYLFASIGFSTGAMFYFSGLTRELMLYVASYATGLGFLFALLQASGFLFHFKDYEIIGPLPIKPLSLLLAKLMTMMVFIYIVLTALTLPIFIVYYIFVPFDILGFILLLLGYSLLPLPAIILGSFLSLIIARISKHFAKSNLIQTILMFVIFLTIFGISLIGGASGDQGSMIPVWVIDAISAFYLPNEWYASAVHENNLLNFVYLLLSHALVFTIFLLIISKLSVKTNQNRTANKQVIIKSNKLRKTPILTALIKKEWRKFVGTPIYIFNCGFGLIMLVIMAVASVFLKDAIAAEVGFFSPFILLIAYGFCVVTVYTPAISLSLEGRNFGLLKTLPIKGETIMSAKIIFNLLLLLPVIIITLPFASYGLGLDIWTALSGFLVLVSFAILTSIFFAWLNLFFPRFDFKTEAEIVKQSMSSFIAVFGGMGFMVLEGAMLVGIMFLLSSLHIAFSLLVLVIVNALLSLAIYWPMHKKADGRLQKMEA